MTIPHSDALVFFGATGDLAYKKIFPALAFGMNAIAPGEDTVSRFGEPTDLRQNVCYFGDRTLVHRQLTCGDIIIICETVH
jgi:hypothetical protein